MSLEIVTLKWTTMFVVYQWCFDRNGKMQQFRNIKNFEIIIIINFFYY